MEGPERSLGFTGQYEPQRTSRMSQGVSLRWTTDRVDHGDHSKAQRGHILGRDHSRTGGPIDVAEM